MIDVETPAWRLYINHYFSSSAVRHLPEAWKQLDYLYYQGLAPPEPLHLAFALGENISEVNL